MGEWAVLGRITDTLPKHEEEWCSVGRRNTHQLDQLRELNRNGERSSRNERLTHCHQISQRVSELRPWSLWRATYVLNCVSMYNTVAACSKPTFCWAPHFGYLQGTLMWSYHSQTWHRAQSQQHEMQKVLTSCTLKSAMIIHGERTYSLPGDVWWVTNTRIWAHTHDLKNRRFKHSISNYIFELNKYLHTAVDIQLQ